MQHEAGSEALEHLAGAIRDFTLERRRVMATERLFGPLRIKRMQTLATIDDAPQMGHNQDRLSIGGGYEPLSRT